NHLDIVQEPQHECQTLADHALVVGDEYADPTHAGTSSSTRNPVPVCSAMSVPPSSSARSRMPVSPYPPVSTAASAEAATASARTADPASARAADPPATVTADPASATADAKSSIRTR